VDPILIQSVEEKIVAELNTSFGQVIQIFPFHKYVECLENTGKYANYRNINPSLLSLNAKIKKAGGEIVTGFYNKLLLVHLIKESYKKLDDSPVTVKELNSAYFQRILNQLNTEDIRSNLHYYQLNNDKFLKDIGICRISLLLAGPVLLDSGFFPLKYLYRSSIINLFKGLVCVIRYNCLIPVFKMHTHISNPLVMSKFTEEGWRQFYYDVAEIMQKGNNSRGIYCAGWFFDPVLEEISPELSYLGRQVKKIGGVSFKLGTNDKVIRNATFLNKTRKFLYENGKYMPCRYVIFIPRKRLLKWYSTEEE
jgi:hypothetical protein